MINVKLNKEETTPVKPFPKFMVDTNNLIILFKTECCGVVVNHDSCRSDVYHYTIGDYCDSWDMKNFTDYNEPITIQNA